MSKNPLWLLAISDVTCDYAGSIDFLTDFSTIDNPFLVWDPITMTFNDTYKTAKDGILYDSIENMPTQFPEDASENFGRNLYPYV